MNAELKALIKTAIDLYGTGAAVIAKQDFVTAILPKLYSVASDIPGVVSSMGDLSAEIAALKGADAETDLVSYVISSVAGVTSDAHAQKVIQAALVMVEHVVQDALALKAAISGS